MTPNEASQKRTLEKEYAAMQYYWEKRHSEIETLRDIADVLMTLEGYVTTIMTSSDVVGTREKRLSHVLKICELAERTIASQPKYENPDTGTAQRRVDYYVGFFAELKVKMLIELSQTIGGLVYA